MEYIMSVVCHLAGFVPIKSSSCNSNGKQSLYTKQISATVTGLCSDTDVMLVGYIEFQPNAFSCPVQNQNCLYFIILSVSLLELVTASPSCLQMPYNQCTGSTSPDYSLSHHCSRNPADKHALFCARDQCGSTNVKEICILKYLLIAFWHPNTDGVLTVQPKFTEINTETREVHTHATAVQ